eukprot:TRINITY_DN9045_c0_g1_i1.p1 TRINITY_DN9045_c0_g1~~TRINITY_DN9045_c0_g1_i1.p1  ORF type:complete len:941 (-),score=223.08 TRINITY_DN9045_c0_g1_i1:60-2882(-)
MEGIERAVAIAYDITPSPSERPAADAYCNQILESDEGFRRCLSILFESSEPAVHHFCLKAVEHAVAYRYLKLSGEDKALIHDGLMQYFAFIAEHHDLPLYVREKFSQVVVALFRMEYLDSWGTFFDEIRGQCESGNLSCLDIYQRILLAIDDYIISSECFRNPSDAKLANDVKDAMREGAIEKIALDWISILRLGSECSELKELALANLDKYIAWMDIGLVVNDQMLPLLFAGLSDKDIQRFCCGCLIEIVLKGMEPPDKLALLLSLNIENEIVRVHVNNAKFATKLSKLINFIGVEALGTISYVEGDMQKQAIDLSMKSLEIALPFLGHRVDKVSSSCFELINSFVEYVRKHDLGQDEDTIARIGKVLEICHTKLAYPEDFNHEEPDEDEEAFIRYRNSLGQLFRSLVRLQPERVIQYIYNALDQATQNISAVSLIELEVALRMMFLAGQDIADKETYYPALISMIVERKVIEHESVAVPLAFMDVVVRYVRYIPRDEAFLSEVLQMFLGKHGLRHSQRKVRSRSCYFFYRLIKGLLDCIASFSQPIIENLKPLLLVETNLTEDVITIDDQCSLFEALGSMIATVRPGSRATLVEHSLGTVMCQARAVFAEASENVDQLQDPRFGVYVSRILKVFASFAQGFEKKDTSEVKGVFEESMALCADALKMLPVDQNVRAQSVFLLHRMIQSLGADILETITPFVEHLLTYLEDGDGKCLLEFFQLITQIMASFEEKAAPLIDSVFSPLVAKVAPYFMRDITMRSEEGLECDRIQRQFFIFLKYLFSGNLVSVMTSERNVGSVKDVISAVMEPCSRLDGTTMGTKSICFKLLRKMCQHWNNEEFCQIVVDRGFELIFAVPMHPDFVLSDAESQNLLIDITSFQRDALQMNEAMPEHLAKFLSSKGIDEQIVSEYITRLMETRRVRDFAVWLKELLEHMRGQGS